MAAAGFDRFLDELECPVCLLVPRDLPVPACPVGHIVCQTCRENMERCPTCGRRMLAGGTNMLANRMIEEIPHSCKFEEFGCEVRQPLVELVNHEANCPQRTIKCPYLNCNQVVRIRKYYDHALANNCTRGRDTLLFPTSGTSICSSRITTRRDVQSFLDSNNLSWKLHAFQDSSTFQKLFYFHQHYFYERQSFCFYVTIAEHFTVSEKYLAKLKLRNFNDERRYLTSVQNVMSMDSAPKDVDDVFASPFVMLVPRSMMCGFLKWVEVDGEGTKHADVEMTIDILDS